MEKDRLAAPDPPFELVPAVVDAITFHPQEVGALAVRMNLVSEMLEGMLSAGISDEAVCQLVKRVGDVA